MEGPQDGRAEAPVVQQTFSGLALAGIDQWEFVPFEVPPGVCRIAVSCEYPRFETLDGLARSVLDLGLVGPGREFRGWSGGARKSFSVSASEATPGYVAGPLTPGSWAVALGPVVFSAAGMPWRITVELDFGPAGTAFVSRPAPSEVPGRGPGWYRGDMHVHTVHSDGKRSPDELVAAARAGGLDFVGSSEHNTNSANLTWGRHTPEDFLVMAGEEVTTRHGHWLALGLPPDQCVDWRYKPRDAVFPRLAGTVRAAGGAVFAAHPAVPLPGSAWQFGFGQLDGIEVWNGPWTLDDHFAVEIWDSLLRSGHRLTAIGNSDAHKHSDVVGLPQTVVRADSLSTSAVLSALKRSRCYIAESAGVRLSLSPAHPGEDAETPCDITAKIEGAPDTVLTLHTARGGVAATRVPASGTATLTWHAPDPSAHFVRAEARRPQPTATTFSTMVALSNPLWLI